MRASYLLVTLAVFSSVLFSALKPSRHKAQMSLSKEESAELSDVPQADEAQVRQELPRTVLPDGTLVHLRITRTLSTATAKVGDRVEFEVVQDIKVADLVVVPRRASAWGTVSKIQPRHRPSKSAVLGLEIKAARAVNEEEVPLRGSRSVSGGPTNDAGPLWPVLPLVLRGNDAFISKGGKVEAYVNGVVSFDTESLRQSAASLEKKNAAALASITRGKSEIHIYRHVPDVSGGKPMIYLDGTELARMQGDRYFNIVLDPGRHIFRTDESEISIECKAGEEYYVRVERQGSFIPKTYLFLVAASPGEDEIYPLEPANPKDFVDHSRLALLRTDN